MPIPREEFEKGMAELRRLLRTVRALVLSLIIVFVVAAVVVTGGFAFLREEQSRSIDLTAAIAAGTDLQACRSEYASRSTEANNVVAYVDSERVDHISEIILASQDDDDTRTAAAALRLAGAQVDAADARTAAETATEGYRAAVRLSRDDPARFLEECRQLDD